MVGSANNTQKQTATQNKQQATSTNGKQTARRRSSHAPQPLEPGDRRKRRPAVGRHYAQQKRVPRQIVRGKVKLKLRLDRLGKIRHRSGSLATILKTRFFFFGFGFYRAGGVRKIKNSGKSRKIT
jgi:DNA-nicking Smr family endonuclease